MFICKMQFQNIHFPKILIHQNKTFLEKTFLESTVLKMTILINTFLENTVLKKPFYFFQVGEIGEARQVHAAIGLDFTALCMSPTATDSPSGTELKHHNFELFFLVRVRVSYSGNSGRSG